MADNQQPCLQSDGLSHSQLRNIKGQNLNPPTHSVGVCVCLVPDDLEWNDPFNED